MAATYLKNGKEVVKILSTAKLESFVSDGWVILSEAEVKKLLDKKETDVKTE